jgi:coenzyme PQQ precursor peptide PqqA
LATPLHAAGIAPAGVADVSPREVLAIRTGWSDFHMPNCEMVLAFGLMTGAFARLSTLTESAMTWTTPTITEVCVGMEVTSYESAEF